MEYVFFMFGGSYLLLGCVKRKVSHIQSVTLLQELLLLVAITLNTKISFLSYFHLGFWILHSHRKCDMAPSTS